MNIILKFVMRNIAEKKLRTFLIIFSIMISSALFFASTAITGTMEKMIVEQMRSRIGESHIIVTQGDQQTTPFFLAPDLGEYQEQLNYMIGTIETRAVYRHGRAESVPWALRGMEIEDLQVMTPITFAKESQLMPFQGRKVILGQGAADKYGFQVGDAIEFEVAGEPRLFRIAGIASPMGPFRDEGQAPFAVVPKETLSSLFDVRGRLSTLYISLANPAQAQQLIDDIAATYPRYNVQEALPQTEIASMIGPITTPFLFLTMVVLAVSAFIIYTSFKLIAKERLPVIGTFRSIGATKKATSFVMVAESLLYGLFGGAFGCILGLGVLSVMSRMIMPSWAQGAPASIHFTPLQLLIAFLIAVFLSLASAIFPIKKAAGIPLKDIILDTEHQGVKSKNNISLIYALVFISAALILPPVMPRELGTLTSGVGMLLSIVATILLVPYLTAGFVRIFEKGYMVVFGNEGVLALKNLRQNNSILNSISLLALGISSLLVVNTVSYSVVKEVANIYTRNVGYEVSLQGGNLDESMLGKAAAADGVVDVYGNYFNYNVELVGKNGWINFHAPTSTKFFHHMTNLGVTGDYHQLLTELNADRNIVITTILKDRHQLQLGDTLTIDMKSGPRDYKVIGFIDTLMDNGNFSLIGQRYHKLDMQPQYYQAITMRITGTQKEVTERLKDQFRQQQVQVSSVDEWEARNHASNKQLFDILRGFSILTLVIGIFGVLNNLFISFIERKRALAMLRSVGMSKRQVLKMIFIESLSGGLIGGVIGVLGAILMLSLMPYLLLAMNAPIPITYSSGLLLLSLLAGVVIMIIASVSPALKSSRLNIMESLKYE